eukprot:jgi/Astpho2/5004/Aster-x1271
MIKLFSVKEKQKKDAAANAGKGVKQSADISELNLTKGTSIVFPEGKDNLMHFQITIKPEDGLAGNFVFDFVISTSYPHDAPKVKCKTKVYHPNIDLEGNVCLNILREDWKPVLSINSVIYGLQYLFLDPNPDDPLNKDAAQMMQESPRQFETYVTSSLTRGCSIQGSYFPPCK